jgi:GTP diphosphokinase / guanosine-3',5'-bis(diphosphate) 3'-diphosphatase
VVKRSGIMSENQLDQRIVSLYRKLLRVSRDNFSSQDIVLVRKAFNRTNELCKHRPGQPDNPRIIHALSMAIVVVEEIGLGAASVVGALLYSSQEDGSISPETIKTEFGEYIFKLMDGLQKISSIPLHQKTVQAGNLRELIISLARDVRVILIRLVDILVCVRKSEKYSSEEQLKLAFESLYLYAPLAHRLGLYNIKTELEDKALMITEPEAYHQIDQKIKDSARKRNRFIKEFIGPIEKSLNEHELLYEIKSRTKSVFSIYNKINKQHVDFEEVYDLFAIRIIIDTNLKKEKEDCWRVYSIVTDIYQPNPLRLRDWISIPKSNGYESLHTTVVVPGGTWVEVQIRTKRMDEIAEKGLAAHWKYKGAIGEKGLDEWMKKVRELIETPEQEPAELIDDFKLSLYSKEIFVFTPRGDLRRLPKDSTVLDFAFEIHTGVGSTCTGAKVNGKIVPIRYVLNNGDRVEIITSKNQKPKQDWLDFVVTSKAKAKIKQSLNEELFKEADHGKEIIKRRFRNWKIVYNDENIRKLIHHYKFKTAVDLYYQVASEKIDLADIKEVLTHEEAKVETAPIPAPQEIKTSVMQEKASDFLVIDEKLGNLDYKLSKCCNPIFGDPIFGFVTINEGIKIHRTNCPNAAQLLNKYGYRIVKASWSKSDDQTFFEASIKVTGIDELGVVSRLTDVISRDLKVNMRSISIESQNGYYEGLMKILVKDIRHLDILIGRLQKLKGVVSATRLDVQG